MISLSKRIDAFVSLGEVLLNLNTTSNNPTDDSLLTSLDTLVKDATHYNGWFIEKNVRYMLISIGESLSKENIDSWIEPYLTKIENNSATATVGVVMAGNIPLVGFHDFLCVLISGNKILAKLSSGDDKLLPLIADILIDIEPEFKEFIKFTSAQLLNIDAIIATGSDNTSRYFEYYFGKYPNIIRRNRNGIAVLTGNETEEELEQLCDDIFMYFGLGCRNVSHLIVPVNYNFTKFLEKCESNTEISINHKYFNNYEYNKAIYLVNSVTHFDTGNILLVEDNNFSTPVSVISYEYYSNIEDVNNLLNVNNDKIQCIISSNPKVNNRIPFGSSQSPQLSDYADNINTLNFLTTLPHPNSDEV